MRNILRLLGATSMLVCATSAQAADCQSFATSTTTDVVGIFHSTVSEAEKKKALYAIFEKSVDTKWIGKYVLGHYWDQATPDQQTAYLNLYAPYLSQTYISKFNDEDGLKVDAIKVVSVTPQKDHEYLAKTVVQQKGEEDVSVDYTLSDASGTCQVHDIIAEGVSLLVTQRSDFSSLAASKGVAGITEVLKTKVHSN